MSWLMDRDDSIFIEYVALPPHLRPPPLAFCPQPNRRSCFSHIYIRLTKGDLL